MNIDFPTFLNPQVVSKRTRIIFPVLYGLLIYISIRLANDVISDSPFWLRPLRTTMAELIFGAVANYIFAYGVWYLLQYNLNKSDTRPSVKQNIRELAVVAAVIEVIAFCTLLPLTALTDNGVQVQDIIFIGSIPLLFWLLYYAWLRVNVLIKKSYEQQLQIEKINNDRLNTELQFLKAQFHPHFLFNALNTIYFQIDETNKTAKGTVEKLAELLRYQLYDRQETVPLQREIEYLNAYIEFQKERVSESLTLEYNVEGIAEGLEIYPLLLIPLVENAFKYVGGEYCISLNIAITKREIFCEVVNSVPLYQPAKPTGGIGLENLQRRLNLLYEGCHKLSADKVENKYIARLIISL